MSNKVLKDFQEAPMVDLDENEYESDENPSPKRASRALKNLGRFVPANELLGVHKEIMKKICPLASASFFDTISGTFLSVLTNAFRWKEPYLEQRHYLRILTSLSLCKSKATMMEFAHPKTIIGIIYICRILFPYISIFSCITN